MLAMEKGTGEERLTAGEGLRDGTDRSSLRFGYSTKYVIARRGNGALELLRAPLPSGGEALPVFATEQAAWRYLWSEALEIGGWSVRESGDGELVSLLMSLCRGVQSVLLDPEPAPLATADSAALVDRDGYVHTCLSAGRLTVGAIFATGGCGR